MVFKSRNLFNGVLLLSSSLLIAQGIPGAAFGQDAKNPPPPGTPLPKGCKYDLSQVDTVIINCKGGDPKVKLHATIRCADKFGFVHLRTGKNISARKGTSVAKCDYEGWGEHGPYKGPTNGALPPQVDALIRAFFPPREPDPVSQQKQNKKKPTPKKQRRK